MFSPAIKYLKDYLLQKASNSVNCDIGSDDVKWVLKVQAIWNDSAKPFIREAAQHVVAFYSLFNDIYVLWCSLLALTSRT